MSQYGPCAPWIQGADLDCLSGSADGDLATEYAALASDLLYVWSGRQFSGAGACTSTARPAPKRLTRHPFHGPVGWDGWTWGFACACQHADRVKLPGYPVTEILEVVIDGVAVAGGAYRLEAARYLVRQDGGLWPACQNEDAALGSAGTWSVKYRHGADPPLAGVVAAKTLGCELYLAATGGKCALPSGVTRVVRQGVTFERVQAAFSAGRITTGITVVDAFLATYNPGGQRRRTAVMSPDTRFARRV